MKTAVVRLLFVLTWLTPFGATAQTVTRGPYLQMGSASAITVRWRTDVSTDSVVRYGLTSGNLNLTATSGTARTEHEIRLAGLSADTTYFYSVGNAAGTLAGGSDFFFVTAPTTARPTRIWVLGDAGTGTSVQTSVRNAYYAFTGTRHTNLWLMLGDNAYNSGTDAEYTAKAFNIYPTMFRKSVVWATLGNHDGTSADSQTQTGPYYQIFTLPANAEAGGVASGTEAYYSFNYGNIHFVCLDSYDTDRSANGAMAQWLKSDLLNNTRDWLVAFFHHPPYSKGSHDSDTSSNLVDMRQNFVPILENYGVDLVLSGHSHSYERSRFIDGHYGVSSTFNSATMVKQAGSGEGAGAYLKSTVGPVPHAGAVYAVPGASGQTSGGTLNHPAMYVSLNVAGSMILDFDGSALDATYLDSTGVVRDRFSIRKGSVANTPPTVALTSPANGASYVAPASITLNATASDSDGTVSQVEFRSGSTPIGTDPSAPYSFTWNGVPAGTYTLSAIATDNGGASTFSNPVTVTVNNPGNVSPSVALTSPANGATYASPATIALSASASDPDGSISRVDFMQGGTLLGTAYSSPYAYTWGAVPAGNYTLTAVATDNGGATTTSAPITVRVTSPPAATTISLQQGVDGYSGTTDTTLRSDAAKSNYGNSPTLLVDGSPDCSVLIKWDLSSIPAGKTVTNVTLEFNAVDAPSGVYELYELKRSWNESNANWTRAAGGSNWQVPGAAGSNDRGSVVLGAISAATLGNQTITLNAAGIAVVQAWIATPSKNFGFIIQDYSATDGLDLTSSEGSSASLRPKITITCQ